MRNSKSYSFILRTIANFENIILSFNFFLQMDPEVIRFGRFTLPIIPKSEFSFQIHKDIENQDKRQKCILDNLWNTQSKDEKN